MSFSKYNNYPEITKAIDKMLAVEYEKGRWETVELVDKMLERAGLQLRWISKGGKVLSYGLSDKHGNKVDVLQLLKP